MAVPPESTKNSLLYRLHTHARNNWPQITDLDVRYRGQFAYITAELADGTSLDRAANQNRSAGS